MFQLWKYQFSFQKLHTLNSINIEPAKNLLKCASCGMKFLTFAKTFTMPNWLRALVAGYGAKKLGGGCLSTIVIFLVLYWLLGQHC